MKAVSIPASVVSLDANPVTVAAATYTVPIPAVSAVSITDPATDVSAPVVTVPVPVFAGPLPAPSAVATASGRASVAQHVSVVDPAALVSVSRASITRIP